MELKTLSRALIGAALCASSAMANASHPAVGNWNLNFDWNCDGTYSRTPMTFNAGGTFSLGGAVAGNWFENHGTLVFVFTPSGTTYSGYHVNKSMTGVQRAFASNLDGCWYAHPNDGAVYDAAPANSDGGTADGIGGGTGGRGPGG